MENLLSGNGALDAATGGFGRGSVVLCYGPPEAGTENFVVGVLGRALSSGEGAMVVLTAKTTAEFRKGAYKQGVYFAKFEESGTCYFVDAYSRLIGSDEAGSGIVVNGPSDLAGMTAGVAKCNANLFRKGIPSLFVLDSLSSLLLHNSGPAIAMFLDALTDMLKKTNATIFLVFNEPFGDVSLSEEISKRADVKLDFKQENGKYFMRTGTSQWLEFGWKGAP